MLCKLTYRFLSLVLSLMTSFVAMASEGVKAGIRLPLIHTMAGDFFVPRLGLETEFVRHKLVLSAEYGLPVRASNEKQPAKGVYTAFQMMRNIGKGPNGFNSFLGLRASYLKGSFRDFLRYDEHQSGFEYSRYRMTDIAKTRLMVGLTYIGRQLITKHLFCEIQLDFGYTRNEILVNDDVDQVYFFNGIFVHDKYFEGPFLNVGLNLFYSVF